MVYLQDIIDWRNKAKKWEIYKFAVEVTHEQVLNMCMDINTYFETIDCEYRVRKSWKSIEACDKEDEL